MARRIVSRTPLVSIVGEMAPYGDELLSPDAKSAQGAGAL